MKMGGGAGNRTLLRLSAKTEPRRGLDQATVRYRNECSCRSVPPHFPRITRWQQSRVNRASMGSGAIRAGRLAIVVATYGLVARRRTHPHLPRRNPRPPRRPRSATRTLLSASRASTTRPSRPGTIPTTAVGARSAVLDAMAPFGTAIRSRIRGSSLAAAGYTAPSHVLRAQARSDAQPQ